MKLLFILIFFCSIITMTSVPHALAQGKQSHKTALDDWLDNINGAKSGQRGALSGPELRSLMPKYSFHTLRFPSYPVARETPLPLNPLIYLQCPTMEKLYTSQAKRN